MWQSIETAPKDGRLVLLLAAESRSVNLGKWWPDGTSWVDEHGQLGGDCYTLAQTGVWESGGGWFQPNEVTHWHPLPAIDCIGEPAVGKPLIRRGEGEPASDPGFSAGSPVQSVS